MQAAGSAALLVKQPGSAVADLLARTLGGVGVRVTTVETPYAAIVEAAQAAVPYRYLLVGVDHFGRDEFRLVPMVCREWPETIVVAYHSPGFEYKGALADLVGAKMVVAGLDGVSTLLDTLTPEKTRDEAPAEPSRKPEQEPAEAPAEPSRKPEQEPAEALEPPSPTQDAPTPALAHVELTEEELRLLLAEEDDT